MTQSFNDDSLSCETGSLVISEKRGRSFPFKKYFQKPDMKTITISSLSKNKVQSRIQHILTLFKKASAFTSITCLLQYGSNKENIFFILFMNK